MANVETVMNWSEINVGCPVGRGGVNQKDDVLVIQALLKYALEGRDYFRRDKFPEPTGALDPDTARLIEKYQRYLRRKRELKISVDGRVDPANGSIYVTGKRLKWTITMLNGDAMEMHLTHNRPGESYIHGICLFYPQVRAVLGELPTGTLGLPLEGSSNGTGSLDLGLE